MSHFNEKIQKNKDQIIGTIDTEYISNSINRSINGKDCSFEFTSVTSSEVRKCLTNIKIWTIIGNG